MKFRNILFLALLFSVFSCNKKSQVETAVEQMPLQVKLYRFDQAFFNTTPQSLPKLKQQFPFFFTNGFDDKVWIDKIQNPQWRELYNEVQLKYKNFDSQKLEIETLFSFEKILFLSSAVNLGRFFNSIFSLNH